MNDISDGQITSQMQLKIEVALKGKLDDHISAIADLDRRIKRLSDKRVLAQAGMAVRWSKEIDSIWRQHAREVVLVRIISATLDRRSAFLTAQCANERFIDFADLPLAKMLSSREANLDTLTEAALAEGIVTSAEVQEARNGRL